MGTTKTTHPLPPAQLRCQDCGAELVSKRPAADAPAGTKVHLGRGLCGAHYQARRRNGSLDDVSPVEKDPAKYAHLRSRAASRVMTGIDQARTNAEAITLHRLPHATLRAAALTVAANVPTHEVRAVLTQLGIDKEFAA